MLLLHKNEIGLYLGMDPRLDTALTLIRSGAPDKAAPGTYMVSDALFYMVQRYPTRDVEDTVWEAHSRHIDIQYLQEGTEEIGVAIEAGAYVLQECREVNDVSFFTGPEGSRIRMEAGSIAVFYPADLHRPCIGGGEPVRKTVFKIEL